MNYLVSVAFLLLLLLTASCHARRSHRGHHGWTATVPNSGLSFGVRGGGEGETSTVSPADDNSLVGSGSSISSPFSVLSVITWRASDDENPKVTVNPCPPPPSLALSPGCMLLDDKATTSTPLWTARGLWPKHQDDEENSRQLLDVWNILAMLSDVVVLAVEITSSDDMYPVISSELIQSFVQGLRQRVESGLSKSRLILLLNHPAEPEELASWRESLSVVEGISELTEDILDRFFICSTTSFQEAMDDILLDQKEETSGVLSVLGNDSKAFAVLLEQIFELKMNQSSDTLLREEDPGSSLLPPPPRSTTEETPENEDVSHTIPIDEEDEQDNDSSDTLLLDEKEEEEEPDRSVPSVELSVETTTPAVDTTAILHKAVDGLKEVESKLQEGWLLDPGKPPQDFAQLTNPILQELQIALEPCVASSEREEVEQQVGLQLRSLYLQHLDTLRNFYGTMYETLLDQHEENPDAFADAAKRVSKGFQKAALDAVPSLARRGQVFFDAADLQHADVFGGLLQDMAAAAELRSLMDVSEESSLPSQQQTSPHRRRNRVVRWMTRMGARALVFGVNYLQGWLAWQAVRRSALERERNLPKFPLF